jgi:hypothetical protein
MRALCGAIITAGALIGLGLAAIGIGNRYAAYPYLEKPGGDPQWVKFWQMDVSLILIVTLLICVVIVGIGISILGLAYHHHRRHMEHLRAQVEHDSKHRVAVS